MGVMTYRVFVDGVNIIDHATVNVSSEEQFAAIKQQAKENSQIDGCLFGTMGSHDFGVSRVVRFGGKKHLYEEEYRFVP